MKNNSYDIYKNLKFSGSQEKRGDFIDMMMSLRNDDRNNNNTNKSDEEDDVEISKYRYNSDIFIGRLFRY